MDTYSLLREFADSWALLGLTLFYVGAIVWVFRPGSRALHADAAQVPFRHDTPDADTRMKEDETCASAVSPSISKNKEAAQ